MVNGAPKEVPEGDLQYSPDGLHEYSRDLLRGLIYHDSPRVSHRFSFLRCIGPILVFAADTAHAPVSKKLLGERSAVRGNYSSAPVVSYTMLHSQSTNIDRV